MEWLGAVPALVLIIVVFIDAFEAMILPRRVRHGYRLARLFYRSAWVLWRALAIRLPAGRWRNAFLAIFGPLSLFALVIVWAAGLITGFAMLHWFLGTGLKLPAGTDDSFATYWYFSGTTFFTLGYGDLVPTSGWGRTLSVVESGIGFGFLAVIVSYLPVLYQAFSRREITISLLDARAGSPPSAGELLRRVAEARNQAPGVDACAGAVPLLSEWERWAAELLESHLSYPVLTYYRSQHDNQSWVATLTMILDTTALLITSVESPDGYQARLTFAMARHAAVDLGLVFLQVPPRSPEPDRLPATELARLRQSLHQVGLKMSDSPEAIKALTELRSLYEPIVNALAVFFLLPLPPFQPEKAPVDNWQTSPWMPRSPGLSGLRSAGAGDEHFD
jgi:hypothetical protein